MDVSFEITGAAELLRRLKAVGDEKRMRKIATAAARKAMNIVRNAARANAQALDDPQTAETIAKNIVTQNSGKAGRAVGGVVMRVGIMGGANTRSSQGKGAASNPGGDTRHWRYIEFGTEHTAAHPFFRRALETNVERVSQVVTEEMSRQIDKPETFSTRGAGGRLG